MLQIEKRTKKKRGYRRQRLALLLGTKKASSALSFARRSATVKSHGFLKNQPFFFFAADANSTLPSQARVTLSSLSLKSFADNIITALFLGRNATIFFLLKWMNAS